METDIEIWDLDTLDVLEPALILGGPKDSDRGRPPQLEDDGKKKRKLKKGSHKNSVLSLAWNATATNVLASGSADKTIKVRQQTPLASSGHRSWLVLTSNRDHKTILYSGSGQGIYPATPRCL